MTSRGKVTVICGPMFSGKSNELIRRYTRASLAKKPVIVFKSGLDTRFEGKSKVCTHSGESIPAIPVDSTSVLMQHYSLEVAKDTTPDTIIVDEVQFFDNLLVYFVDVLAEMGHEVVLAGTDTTFAGKPFGIMGDLLCIADEVVKLDAVCVKCGNPAIRNQRLIEGVPASAESPEIMVGASDTYEARCRNCHKVGD